MFLQWMRIRVEGEEEGLGDAPALFPVEFVAHDL